MMAPNYFYGLLFIACLFCICPHAQASEDLDRAKATEYLYTGFYLNLDHSIWIDKDKNPFWNFHSKSRIEDMSVRRALNESLARINALIEQSPEDTYLYCDKAKAFQKLSNLKEALDAANKSLAIRETAFALYRRASIYFDQENYAGTIADTTRILELTPNTQFPLVLRMSAYEKTKARTSAFKDQIAILNIAQMDIERRKQDLEDEIERNKHGLSTCIFGGGFSNSEYESWYYPWLFNH